MATSGDKIRLLRGLLHGERTYNGPFWLTVDVTRRCNLQCLGCPCHSPLLPAASPRPEDILDLPLDLFARISAELRELRTPEVVFSGEGEPFLHPGAFELVTLAKRAGCKVKMFTNGTLLNTKHIQEVLESGLDSLRISLWAGSREEYARHFPGTTGEIFPEIIEGVRRLTAARSAHGRSRTSVGLHQPLSRHNARHIDEFLQLALESGCDSVSFSPLRTWDGLVDALSLSQDEEQEVCSRLRSAARKLHGLPLRHNIPEMLRFYEIGRNPWQVSGCYIPWLQARVRVDGGVRPCFTCRHEVGNLHRERLAEIWNGRALREWRSSLAGGGEAFAVRHCDCTHCCHLSENLRVHRLFRWISPFVALWRRPA